MKTQIILKSKSRNMLHAKFVLLCLVFVFSLVTSTKGLAATQVSQFGITWTFDKDYTVGQFANGDYYVVGPVTIQSINPPSTNSGGRVKNGSQVNPNPTLLTVGYDNSDPEVAYDATLNKGLNMPLVLPAGSSLISTISFDAAGTMPTQLKTACVLTVLASAPPAGSFRPAYCGGGKTIKFNKSQLDYGKLGKLTPTASAPAFTDKYLSLDRVWLDHTPYWIGRSMHPADNMPDYGRDMSAVVGTVAMLLNCNYTDAQKEKAMIGMVQLGIDNYGVIANGGTKNWTAQCGHSSSRKWPILFAGIVLNDADMKAIGTDTRFANSYSQYACFGEDAQTFYVNKVYNDYTSADFGLPEYGDYHDNDPTGDKRFWDETGYRCCCTATSWTGYILAAHIMGAKTLWNHDALFDYQDRFMSVEKEWRCQSAFCCEMWDRYRANYGCVWTRTNPNDIYSNGSNNCDSNSPPANQAPTANAGSDQTVTDTDNNGSQAVTLNGSGSSDTDGSITSYVWKEGTTQIATGITPSVILAVGTHTVTLTVTDNGGLTSTDTVVITVNAPGNQAPTANAGPDQTVTDTDNNGSQQVTLNGSGSSDAGGSITSYLWTEGSTQIATGVTPNATLNVGAHTITLTVTDNGGLTATDTVVITVQAPTTNQTPTANAGPDQTVTDTDNNGSHSVTLNGSGSSDPDGSITSYIWKEGSTQIATGVRPSVTRTVGTHTITLTVTDNSGLTATDTVVIKVNAPNKAPIANAGPDQTVTDTDNNGSQRIYLYGYRSSDPGGRITSYIWREGSTQIASGAMRLVTLTVGTHTIMLTVTDNSGLTATDTVVINVNAPANQTMLATYFNVPDDGPEGLVGYWKFDDGSGQTAADSSGSNIEGLLVNGPTWTTQGEISFDGNDDAVEVNTVNMKADSGTIALWARANAFTNSTHYLFGESTQPWGNRIQLYCDQSGALNLGMGDNHYLETSIQTLNAGEWYHIALTWDGTNYAVYVDGTLKASGTYTGLSALETYADIGNDGYSSERNEAFNGLIDEVQVYNIAIGAEEIANIALVFLPVDDKTVAEGDELSFTVRTKPGTTVSLEDSNLPGTPSFASDTFKWTPGDNDAGTYQVELTASNGSLTDSESITITVTETPSPDINVVGLAGYWKFDDGSGQTAADSSGSNLAGLLVNGPAWTAQGEISFDGDDDAVEVNTVNMKADSGTIALWARANAFTNSTHYLFGESTQPWGNRIQLYCNQTGGLSVGLGDNHNLATNIQTLNAGEWYHIALTWDGTNYAVYVDGTLKASGSYTGLSALETYADIGNNGNSSERNEAFNGLIDEVQVYNIAIGAEEIVTFAGYRQ